MAVAKGLNTNSASPLTAVRRPAKGLRGDPEASVATSPMAVDAIVREAYGRIYLGSTTNAIVQEYMREYDRHIYKAPEATVEAMTGVDL